MEIKQIDDRRFRETVVKNFHWHNSNRRYELHFTDLINCLLCTVKRKVLPDGDADDFEESYTQVLDWIGGLGFDNLITERISGKTTTWIDGAQGNVDMVFENIPYELTSTLYLNQKVKAANDDLMDTYYRYKLEQLRLYMAGIGKTTGKLKIIERAGDRGGMYLALASFLNGKRIYKRPRPKEHTWKVEMTPLELAHVRIDFIRRKDLLCEALATGNITKLFELRDTVAPILKTSFCTDKETGYCREWPLFQGKNWHLFQKAQREWLTLVCDTDEPTPMAQELRRWM